MRRRSILVFLWALASGATDVSAGQLRAPGSGQRLPIEMVAPQRLEGLESWLKAVSWEVLLNRAGTTFRKLPEAAKSNLTEARAVKLMLEQPSMIKRPVLEHGKTLLVGFSPEKYAALK